MFRQQAAGQNLCILEANKSFQNMAKYKILGTTVTSKNYIHEEIKE
jgi:hypothetical protein